MGRQSSRGFLPFYIVADGRRSILSFRAMFGPAREWGGAAEGTI